MCKHIHYNCVVYQNSIIKIKQTKNFTPVPQYIDHKFDMSKITYNNYMFYSIWCGILLYERKSLISSSSAHLEYNLMPRTKEIGLFSILNLATTIPGFCTFLVASIPYCCHDALFYDLLVHL